MSALGVDLYCISDLDPAGRTVSGNEALAQALARRLQTPRGSLAAIGDDRTVSVKTDLATGTIVRFESIRRVTGPSTFRRVVLFED